MVKVTRERGGFSAQMVSFVGIFSCTSVRDPQLGAAIGKALASRALLKLKSVRLDQHEPMDTCILHTTGVCVSHSPTTQPAPAN